MMKASPEEIEARMNLTYRKEKPNKMDTGMKRQKVVLPLGGLYLVGQCRMLFHLPQYF